MNTLANKNYKTAKFLMVLFGAMAGSLVASETNAALLTAGSGVGTFTINFDREAFAVLQGGTIAAPGVFNAHFYNTAESDYSSVTMNSMLTGGGMAEEPSTALVHDITATGPSPTVQATGRHVQGTTADFAIETTDLSGTGALGMTGVQKYGIGSGPFAGMRMVYGDYSLKYNPALRGGIDNLSGWYLENHVGGTMDAYDLTNLLVSAVDGNNWSLTGNLVMSAGTASMLVGVKGTPVGNFCLGVGSQSGCAAVSTVPVPAAVWLFGTGLAAFSVPGVRRSKLIA